MPRYNRNWQVQEMRDRFVSCPGCGRDRDRIVRDRPHPDMHINQLITVDHMAPRARGGSNHLSNFVIVCHRCNFTRGSQSPWDWFGAQHLIYQAGWPVPPQFFGRRGEENRRLWRNRAQLVVALLGFGPVEFEGDFLEREPARFGLESEESSSDTEGGEDGVEPEPRS